MTDVLKIAIERREALFKEIAALDRFVETAHALISLAASNQSRQAEAPQPASAPEPAAPAEAAEKEPEESIVQMDPVKSPEATSRTEAFLRNLNAFPGKQEAQEGSGAARGAMTNTAKASTG